jgi:CRP/FNR family transcriptional regulator, polysaccharide utilization system transcription regulator
MFRDKIGPPSSCLVENKHSACFDVLTQEESEILSRNSVDIKYKKGEVIAKQGSFASHVIYLTEGLVKVHIEGGQKDLVLKIIPPEHFIGLSSIYDGNNAFIYSATAYVDAEASLIDVGVFKNLIRRNPKFAYEMINIQNENAAQVYGRFFCLTRKQSHGLVADLMLCLANRVFKSEKFCLPITRSDLADLTGLSIESVLRIMKEFKKEKIIATRGKNIEILSIEALERISRIG